MKEWITFSYITKTIHTLGMRKGRTIDEKI